MKVSRRQVGKIVAGVAAAGALPASGEARQTPPRAEPVYGGPLDGYTERQLANRHFDPVVYTRERYAAAPRRLRFQATTRAEAETWQRSLGTKLTELIGGFPAERVPLQEERLRHDTMSGYAREKWVFNTRAGMSVVVYLLLPANRPGPHPTVICVPGHGRGVDDIVGIDEKGHDRTDRSGYQHDFALQAVDAGLAALAIEPLAFGARRDPITVRKGASTTACQPAAGGALLLGETMIGWRVWDVMRAVDFIQTQTALDRNRVGLMGISGGGTVTVFGAALEPRIKVAYASGYVNTFRDSIGSLSHCIDNYVPGILNWAEMHDVAGLVAPRPLFVESGEQDNIFPIQASLESFGHVRDIYRLFGAEDRVEQETFPAEHSFWGKRGIPFLAKNLGV